MVHGSVTSTAARSPSKATTSPAIATVNGNSSPTRGTLLGSYTLKAGTGTQKRWLDDGPLYSEVTLKAGVPNGAMKIYDRDGRVVISRASTTRASSTVITRSAGENTLRIEDTFKHGVVTGPRKIWQFWSLLLDETYDTKGKLDGTFTIWRDSGKKCRASSGNYEHGKKIGDWVWTDKNNKVERQGSFADGKKTGAWTEYTDGKITFTGRVHRRQARRRIHLHRCQRHELGRFDDHRWHRHDADVLPQQEAGIAHDVA